MIFSLTRQERTILFWLSVLVLVGALGMWWL
jgi:hypothetical protein